MKMDETNYVRKALQEALSASTTHTASSLATELGRSVGYVTDFLRHRKHSLGALELRSIEQILGLSENQLMPPTSRAQSLVRSYDPDESDDAQIHEEDPSATRFPPDAVKELAASAGLGAGQLITTTYRREGEDHVAEDAIRDDYWRIPPYFVHEVLHARTPDLLVIQGTGDSMEPTIHSGDRLVANTAHVTPSPDGLYAIRDAFGSIVVKRLESYGLNPPRIRIISDNPRHGSQDVGIDEIAIVGKIVFVMKLV
ncbi:MAG: putative phage repressor [Hyphomicrobiales bacterium]|nr:putative phage repressor [Hyphomicrobiales bacterium]